MRKNRQRDVVFLATGNRKQEPPGNRKHRCNLRVSHVSTIYAEEADTTDKDTFYLGLSPFDHKTGSLGPPDLQAGQGEKLSRQGGAAPA